MPARYHWSLQRLEPERRSPPIRGHSAAARKSRLTWDCVVDAAVDPEIFSAVFVGKLPFVVRPKHGLDIVGRVAPLVTRRGRPTAYAGWWCTLVLELPAGRAEVLFSPAALMPSAGTISQKIAFCIFITLTRYPAACSFCSGREPLSVPTEDRMPMFICSLNWTDQGIRSVKDAPKRAQAAQDLAKKVGVEIKEVYLTSATTISLSLSIPLMGTTSPNSLSRSARRETCVRAPPGPGLRPSFKS